MEHKAHDKKFPKLVLASCPELIDQSKDVISAYSFVLSNKKDTGGKNGFSSLKKLSLTKFQSSVFINCLLPHKQLLQT